MIHPASGPRWRAPVVERLNRWLERAWAKGWSSKPLVDPDRYRAAALRAEGADRFVDDEDGRDAHARLDALADALHREADLNPLGLTMAHGQIVATLRLRLRLDRLWARDSAIIERPVPPPVVVLGQMRSGTTRMHRLLAADPRLTATPFYEGQYPIPPAGPDLRPARAAAFLAAVRWINPRFDAIHPTTPRAADEEIAWLAHGFSPTTYDSQWAIPSFRAFSDARDPAPIYRRFRKLLQTTRVRHDQPRVLKVPQFCDDLPALASVFPDARYVHVHRDADAVLGSSCSLMANQRTIQSDRVDLRAIGAFWRHRIAKREAALARHLPELPHVSVAYAAMDADPAGEMARVGDFLELPGLGADMKTAARPPAPPHHYRLEDFGIAGPQPTISSSLKK